LVNCAMLEQNNAETVKVGRGSYDFKMTCWLEVGGGSGNGVSLKTARGYTCEPLTGHGPSARFPKW